MKVAVIGDAFVDQYHIGKIRGISAEAAIPVMDKVSTITLPGGAGNVAQNLMALGVDSFYLERAQQNYPVKNRLVTSEGVQLARWDEEDWCRPYERADLLGLMQADAIVVSDYGKGSISEEVIQLLKDVSVPVFVDTKGDPSPWLGSEAVLFPNQLEYKRYEEKYNWFPRVVLKKGAEGIAYLEFGHVVLSRPAQAQFVRSVNGAGDTVIASFALAILAGLSLIEALSFANAAAANVVEQQFQQRWTSVEAAVERMEIFNNEQITQEKYAQIQQKGPGVVSRFGLYTGLADLPRGPFTQAGIDPESDTGTPRGAESTSEYYRDADSGSFPPVDPTMEPNIEQLVRKFFSQFGN